MRVAKAYAAGIGAPVSSPVADIVVFLLQKSPVFQGMPDNIEEAIRYVIMAVVTATIVYLVPNKAPSTT